MNRSRQCVLMIIDGLGDLPVPELDGRTPLEAADTPVLNRLAALGYRGVVDPVTPGEVPNTHSGSGMLFGVLPGETERIMRGPVEASGAGYELSPGDIAVRANFATLEEQHGGLAVVDRRAGRIRSGTAPLAEAISGMDLGDGVIATLLPTDQHRGVLVLSGPGLDPRISDTDSGDRGEARVKGCEPLHPAAAQTAMKVNAFVTRAHRILRDHPFNLARAERGEMPANGILTRGAGAAFTLENLLLQRGIGTAVVAGCNTIIGLARILGFEAVTSDRFTADAETDLEAKMASAVDALDRNQMVYLHVKAPDLFAHDRQPVAKKAFLERLDQTLSVLVDSGAILALTADHTTDSNTGSHTADPVPTLLYDPSGKPPGEPSPVNFGETACRNGNMPRQASHDFLQRLVSLMGY